jgi:hypothetical protein
MTARYPAASRLLFRLGRATLRQFGLTRNGAFFHLKRLSTMPERDGEGAICKAISQRERFLSGRLGTPEANACLNRLEISRRHLITGVRITD